MCTHVWLPQPDVAFWHVVLQDAELTLRHHEEVSAVSVSLANHLLTVLELVNLHGLTEIISHKEW